MTGFNSKRNAARDKLDNDDDDIQVYSDTLTIVYQQGFADGKAAANAMHDLARLGQEIEQEPVAWAVQACSKMWRGEFAEIDAKAEAKRIGGTCVAYPLYTTPPAAQRPWQGLTDEDVKHLYPYGRSVWGKETYEAIEKALKAKNGH